VGTEQLGIQPDAGDPSRDEPCVLARGHALAAPAVAGEKKFAGLDVWMWPDPEVPETIANFRFLG
jgi:hypothetical protein